MGPPRSTHPSASPGEPPHRSPRAANAASADKDECDSDECLRLLPPRQAEQVEQFRTMIRACNYDTEKYGLCLGARDKLLQKRAELSLEFVAFEHVMFVECAEYKACKDKDNAGPQADQDAEQRQWQDFFGLAKDGSSRFAALKAVANHWGWDKVQHYGWAALGDHFNNVLRTAAFAIKSWSDFRIKANRLLLRYSHISSITKRRKPHRSHNPLQHTLLRSIKAWSHSRPFVMTNDPHKVPLPFADLALDDLPPEFGFDKYGLMVWQLHAVTAPRAPGSRRTLGEPAQESALGDGGTADGDTADGDTDGDTANGDTAIGQHLANGSVRPLRLQAHRLSYRQMPMTKHAKPVRQGRQCCAVGIPPSLLRILDSPNITSTTLKLELQRQHIIYRSMCHAHFRKVVDTTAAPAEEDVQMTEEHVQMTEEHAQMTGSIDAIFAELFLRCALVELESKVQEPDSFGERTDKLLYIILSKCTPPPMPDGPGTAVEAYFYTSEEAAAAVELGSVDVPIFTQGQQHFRWDGKGRPISEFFDRMEDLNRTASVQIPSLSLEGDSFQSQSLVDVRNRFLGEPQPSYEAGQLLDPPTSRLTRDPWNLLDLQTPLPPLTLPSFLQGKNCQLLPRVRDAFLMGDSAHRTAASKEDWNEWRDVIEWALLSQGGHNTAPHTDSHGYSTWITVQEGHVGFGWMSNPTPEERAAWMADPHHYTGGTWRYVVIPPGHTVFFRSGTIHFVFRPSRTGQTLALGGHILQWSAVEQWLGVVLDQMRNPHITNEDMERTAPAYVRSVAALVIKRVQNGKLHEMGGLDGVDSFFALVKEFEAENSSKAIVSLLREWAKVRASV